MADLSKLKGTKGRFGSIPKPTKTKGNLNAPEHAPAEPNVKRKQQARAKTGRTKPFGTRVSSKFLEEFNETAFLCELKKVELLETMLENYRITKGFKRKS